MCMDQWCEERVAEGRLRGDARLLVHFVTASTQPGSPWRHLFRSRPSGRSTMRLARSASQGGWGHPSLATPAAGTKPQSIHGDLLDILPTWRIVQMRDSARGAFRGRHRVASTRRMLELTSDRLIGGALHAKRITKRSHRHHRPPQILPNEANGISEDRFCETKPSRPAAPEFCRTKPTGSAMTDFAKRSHRDQRRPNSAERNQRDQRRPILRNEAIATSGARILPNEANYETVGLDRRFQADGLFSRCAPG